jgi:hypothetical protein
LRELSSEQRAPPARDAPKLWRRHKSGQSRVPRSWLYVCFRSKPEIRLRSVLVTSGRRFAATSELLDK